MGCVTTVTKTLEESTGVTNVEFDAATETWTLLTGKDFDQESVDRRVREAGVEHQRRVGRSDDPAWIVRWIAVNRSA